MRIGFITQLLWSRYGEFWRRLIVGAGSEAHLPERERVLKAMNDPRLNRVSSLAFRLAAAQALALADSDLIVAPDLNPEEGATKGSAQDPWIADFPEALAAEVGGLPPILAVPAKLEPAIEALAIRTLHRIIHDPAAVRRVWERHKGTLPAFAATRKPGARGDTQADTAVIGQPWLLSDTLLEHLSQEYPKLISQHAIEPIRLQGEGRRFDQRLVATDSEVIGAARLFARRGSVARLVMVVDEASGADAWLVRQLRRSIRKPLEIRPLTSFPAPELWLGVTAEDAAGDGWQRTNQAD